MTKSHGQGSHKHFLASEVSSSNPLVPQSSKVVYDWAMEFKIVITTYRQHIEAIRKARIEVFVNEQQAPLEVEFDDQDERCIHAVIFDQTEPVATGRLNLEQDGRIGRIAVMKSHRRMGLGSRVMVALEQEAIEANAEQIWFHAQVHAVEFYQSLGYETEGDEFPEDDIPHVIMRKRL